MKDRFLKDEEAKIDENHVVEAFASELARAAVVVVVAELGAGPAALPVAVAVALAVVAAVACLEIHAVQAG
jgi:tRNA A37 threonylcarbamoyladenosine biosynthesis protein TsaE